MRAKIKRNFMNPEQISKHLYCSICSDIYREPLRLFCGHTFCKACIQKWNTKKSTCPLCRKFVNFKYTSQDLLATKLIDDLEVKCNNEECSWIDKLENLQQHMKLCQYIKIDIPEWLNSQNTFIFVEEQNEKQYEIPEISNGKPQYIIDRLQNISQLQKTTKKIKKQNSDLNQIEIIEIDIEQKDNPNLLKFEKYNKIDEFSQQKIQMQNYGEIGLQMPCDIIGQDKQQNSNNLENNQVSFETQKLL